MDEVHGAHPVKNMLTVNSIQPISQFNGENYFAQKNPVHSARLEKPVRGQRLKSMSQVTRRNIARC